MVYLLISGMFLTHMRRPLARLTVEEQKLEGEFRYVNSRLITNAEEVAFYQGNNREKMALLQSFSKLKTHLRKFLEFRVGMGIIDNIVGKCTYYYLLSSYELATFFQFLSSIDFASVVGFYAVSIPFFNEKHPLLSDKRNGGQRLQVPSNGKSNSRNFIKFESPLGLLHIWKDAYKVSGSHWSPPSGRSRDDQIGRFYSSHVRTDQSVRWSELGPIWEDNGDSDKQSSYATTTASVNRIGQWFLRWQRTISDSRQCDTVWFCATSNSKWWCSCEGIIFRSQVWLILYLYFTIETSIW